MITLASGVTPTPARKSMLRISLRPLLHWMCVGMIVALSWFVFWRLLGSAIFEFSRDLSFYLQMAQFATWPTSVPGVVPFMWFGDRTLFLLAEGALNGLVYLGMGAVFLGLRAGIRQIRVNRS